MVTENCSRDTFDIFCKTKDGALCPLHPRHSIGCHYYSCLLGLPLRLFPRQRSLLIKGMCHHPRECFFEVKFICRKRTMRKSLLRQSRGSVSQRGQKSKRRKLTHLASFFSTVHYIFSCDFYIIRGHGNASLIKRYQDRKIGYNREKEWGFFRTGWWNSKSAGKERRYFPATSTSYAATVMLL